MQRISLNMMHIKRYSIYTLLCAFSFFTLAYLWYHSSGVSVKESTWTCTGSGRNQMCEFTNFCVDSSRGPFVITDKEPPRINVMNTGDSEDMWFQPKQIKHGVHADHVDETVFVYALYSPYHFSHSLYNGLMPLYSTMQEKFASAKAWTMRVGTFDNKHTEVDLLLPTTGKDIVLEKADLVTSKQVSPGYKPMCFSKAVVGSGNRCSLWYCDNQIPTEHYASFKSFALSQPRVPNNPCDASMVTYKAHGKYKIGILNRKKTRHITNVPELIQRLMADDIDASVVTIDFEKGCDIVNTAHAVKDLDILIAPFGNGLGAGLFMKNDAALISISARYYNEQWFKYPMTAIGRRIFNFDCYRGECQEFDENLAASILDQVGVHLNKTEMQDFLTTSNPERLLSSHMASDPWSPFLQYHKDVARSVDVERFIPFLKHTIDSKPPSNMSYPETCKTPNVCCDDNCDAALERNVFGEKSVWKNYTL